MSQPVRGLLATLAVLCFLVVLPAGADAAVRSIAPAAVRGPVATFALQQGAFERARRAYVRVQRERVRVAASRVRSAAARGSLLRVRLSRRAVRRTVSTRAAGTTTRRTVKLVVVTAPAPAPTDSTTTAPTPTAPTTTQPSPSAPAPAPTAEPAPAPETAPATAPATGDAPAPTTDTPAPAPATDPSSATDPACLFGAFKAGLWPGACWRPYSADSPFNQRIPAGAKVAPDSSEMVSRVVGFGTPMHMQAGTADTANDWAHPTYYSLPTDPVYTLHCYEASWGRCDIEGMQIRVPAAARPAGGGDAHMTVVDQASGWEYDLYKVRSKPAGGGVLEFRWGGRTRIDGDGLGSDATAARFGNLAGIIRAQEMAAGRIDHALFMVVKCDNGQHVYPAKKSGRSCANIGLPTDGAPPMGTRFQLDMSDAEIDALSVPAWKKTILRAIAQYGMYFGDTGGSSWGLQFESGSTYTSFGEEDKMVSFAKRAGVPQYNGQWIFNLRDGVDYARRLKVVDPCVAQRTC